MNPTTAITALVVPGPGPSRRAPPGQCPDRRHDDQDAGATQALDALKDGELERDDDERVGREGEAEGAGRDLAHLTGEGREAALHLAVADEVVMKLRPASQRTAGVLSRGAIAAGTVVVLRGRDRGAVVAQGPDEEARGMSMHIGVGDEDRRERGWSVDRDEESADHTAQADPQVDQGRS